jgi:integrase
MPRPARPRYHDGNGQWCAKIGPPGKDRRPTVVYFPREIRTEADAWDYFRKYQSEHARAPIHGEEIEVAELIEMYQEWAGGEAKAGRMEPHSWRNKCSHLKWLARHVPARKVDPLGYLKVTDLDVGHMNGLVRAIREKNTEEYAKNVVRTVLAMLNWAARPIEGREPVRILKENPVHGWKSGLTTEKVEKFADPGVVMAFRRWAWRNARWGWISPEAADRFRRKGWIKPTPAIRRKSDRRFDRIFLLMIRFIALTGCRPKEACTARWSDVHWSDDSRTTGTVVLDKWKNRKKTGRKRTIFVTPPVARILRVLDRLEGRNPEWIFTHRIGPRSGNYRDMSIDRRAGEPWPDGTALGAKIRKLRTWAIEDGVASREGKPLEATGPNRLANYLFRHTYISKMLMSGHTSAVTAAMTGTSEEMVNRKYGHIQKDHLARIAEEMVSPRKKD